MPGRQNSTNSDQKIKMLHGFNYPSLFFQHGFVNEVPPISSKTSITSTTMDRVANDARRIHKISIQLGAAEALNPTIAIFDHCQTPISEWSKWGF